MNPRAGVNPAQARALLEAVRVQGMAGPALVAFFGAMYYAALRPAEAVELRRDALTLPADGWGELYLPGSAPETGRAWTGLPARREPRGLKHRGRQDVRIVPCPPPLVRLLRDHLDSFGVDRQGRLFRGARGGPLAAASTSVSGATPVRRHSRPPRSRRRLPAGPTTCATPRCRRG